MRAMVLAAPGAPLQVQKLDTQTPELETESATSRPHSLQQTASLFDHFVGAGEQRWWYREAERLCSL